MCYHHESMDAAGMLRDARRAAGLSQRALASRAAVPQPTVARIESGVVVPRVDTLDRLLAVCGRALGAVERPGMGVDRTLIRDRLRLSVTDRAHLAVLEWKRTRPFARSRTG
jgi:transcriptional regulator with XRE-family HTH domain